MPVKVELLAYEKGFFEFRICAADNRPVTQECLDENVLPIKEGYLAGTPLRFYPQGAGDFRLTVAVPPKMTCNRCVLQWRYHTANSWGTDTVENTQGLGIGPQEEFRNCADIRIGGQIPSSVRNNPFFAPPDERSASAIDKPTDQRKRLASQTGIVSIDPNSPDQLSSSTGPRVNEAAHSREGTFSSGGEHSAFGRVVEKTDRTVEKTIGTPNVKHGNRIVSNKHSLSVKGQSRSSVNQVPIVNGKAGDLHQSSSQTEQTQFVNQNDINAKQYNGHFSLDNVLHAGSKSKLSREQNTMDGTVEASGTRKQTVRRLSGAFGRTEGQMVSGEGFIGGINSQLKQNTGFTEGMDSHLTHGTGVVGRADSQMRHGTSFTGGVDSQVVNDAGSVRTVDSMIKGGNNFADGTQVRMQQGAGFTGDNQKTQSVSKISDSFGSNEGKMISGEGFSRGIDSHLTHGTVFTGGVDNQVVTNAGSVRTVDSQMKGGTKFVDGTQVRMQQGTGFTGDSQKTQTVSQISGGFGRAEGQVINGEGFSGGIDSQMIQNTGFTNGMGSQLTHGTGVVGRADSQLRHGTVFIGGVDSQVVKDAGSVRTNDNQIKGGTNFVDDTQVRMQQGTGFTGASKKTQRTGFIRGLDSQMNNKTRFVDGQKLYAENRGQTASGMLEIPIYVDAKTSGADTNVASDAGASLKTRKTGFTLKEVKTSRSGKTTGQTATSVDQGQMSRGLDVPMTGITRGHTSFGIDGQMQTIRGQNSGRAGNQMQSSDIQSQLGMEGRLKVDGIHSQKSQRNGDIVLLNDIIDIGSGILRNDNIGSVKMGAAEKRVDAGKRIVDIQNKATAVGPAPQPEKKFSISAEGASISSKASMVDSGRMKAATRSGFTLSGERTASSNFKADARQFNNNNQQIVRSATSNGDSFLDMSKQSDQKALVRSNFNSPIQSNILRKDTVISGKSENVGASTSGSIAKSSRNLMTDSAIGGTQTNTIQGKVNANIDAISDRSTGTNFNEISTGNTRVSESVRGSHIDGATTQHTIDTVQSGKRGVISSGQNVLNEPAHAISKLQQSSGRQRIFLVRASRPNTLLLSDSGEGSGRGMTISESTGTGIVRTSIDKTSSASGKALSLDKGNPDNAALKVSKGNRQADISSSKVGVNSLNTASKSDMIVGSQLVDMAASEVLDPLRTQTLRSDGLIAAAEQDFLPSVDATFVTDKKVQATTRHAFGGSRDAVINDVDAFRNELVKSSLRQGGALPAEGPTDASSAGSTQTVKTKGSSNTVGTSLLASNAIGGKSASTSLDQTVTDLLNEAQRILSNTKDITNAGTATITGSAVSAASSPVVDNVSGITNDLKHRTPISSPEMSQNVHESHKSSQKISKGQGVDHLTAVDVTQENVKVPRGRPNILTLEYLLGESVKNIHSKGTDSLPNLVGSSQGHHEHAMSVSDSSTGGTPTNKQVLLSTAKSIHDTSRNIHGTGNAIDKVMHGSNNVAAGSRTGQISHRKADAITTGTTRDASSVSSVGADTSRSASANLIDAGKGNNMLSSQTNVHNTGMGADTRGSLLPNINTISRNTGMISSRASSGSDSNVNEIASQSLAKKQTTETKLRTGIHSDSGRNTASVQPIGPDPDTVIAEHFGNTGVNNVMYRSTKLKTSGISSVGSETRSQPGKLDLVLGVQDFGGTSESLQSGQSGFNSNERMMSGTETSGRLGTSSINLDASSDAGPSGQLGGKVIDLSSSGPPLTFGQRNTATDVNDINLLSGGKTLEQRHGVISDHSVLRVGSIETPSKSSSSNLLSGASKNANRKNTLSSTRKQVDQTVSSRSQRRRIIGGNNIITGQTRSDSAVANSGQDGVSIEGQINSFNLDNLPSSNVIDAGVQMTADGGMTAGFGPRGRDVPRERMTGDRRLMSREDRRRGIIRDDLSRRNTGSSDGRFRVVLDPRTGFEERIPSGGTIRDGTSGNTRGSGVEGSVAEGRHEHHSGRDASSNPMYFLDMSGSQSSETRMIDRTTIRELPADSVARSSERRGMNLRDNRRRQDGGGTGFEMRVGGSRSTADIGFESRGGDRGIASGRMRGGAALDRRMGSSRSATETGRRFQDRGDFRRGQTTRTGFDRGSSRFDGGVGVSGSTGATAAGFRESGSRADPRRGRVGDRGVGGFDVRMEGSVSTGLGFRDGDLRADSLRSGATDRGRADLRRVGPESTGGSAGRFREGDFRVDSRRRMEGDFRGERRGDMRQEGRRMPSRSREIALGDGRSSRRGPIGPGPTVVPPTPMTSTGGSFSRSMASAGGFPPGMTPGMSPGMTSFGGPFPVGGMPFDGGFGPSGLGSVPMGGMPFDGGFGLSGMGSAFGPSLGAPGMAPGMGMMPPSMGTGMGMPPFSPMGFGPGMI